VQPRCQPGKNASRAATIAVAAMTSAVFVAKMDVAAVSAAVTNAAPSKVSAD